MRILVANLGSTSFKYRLFSFDASEERLLARGGQERVDDFGEAIDATLEELREAGHLKEGSDLDAVAFKTVLGRNLTGCVYADDTCLDALEGLAAVAPAHNPAYAAGIRQFARKLPAVPRIALFEPSFYQWAPAAGQRYAIPAAWEEAGLRRYGFHGASHKFIAERAAELMGRDDIALRVRQLYVDGPGEAPATRLRMVSCHLGGSSSITATDNGLAIGNSMGFSPQGGLPQNNRVGDLDAMAVPFVMKTLGFSVDEVEAALTNESGLLGMSGVSNDMRDVHQAALDGNVRAQAAIDAYVHAIRHWIGAFTWQMGGLDALIFTGGIGEHNPWLREAVCAGCEGFGLHLDPDRNDVEEPAEREFSRDGSPVRLFIIPTNEELVVAREARRLLLKEKPPKTT